MKLAGFEFTADPDYITMGAYTKQDLEACKKALMSYVERMGGQVDDPNKFNPFEAGVTSTTGQSAIPGGAQDLKKVAADKITGTKQQIEEIKAKREAELEDHVEDREVQIYHQRAQAANTTMKSASNKDEILAAVERRKAGGS